VYSTHSASMGTEDRLKMIVDFFQWWNVCTWKWSEWSAVESFPEEFSKNIFIEMME